MYGNEDNLALRMKQKITMAASFVQIGNNPTKMTFINFPGKCSPKDYMNGWKTIKKESSHGNDKFVASHGNLTQLNCESIFLFQGNSERRIALIFSPN